MKRKEVTLHKRNEFIRGGDILSIHGKRALNAIYYLIQNNINSGKKQLIENLTYVPIEFPYLRKMLGLEKTESYIKEIQDALTELQKSNIQLNNFKDPRNGEIINWYSISFVADVYWKLDKKTGKKIAYVELSALTKWLMINSNNGNFTKLELIPTINKLRTKYSMKLYEFFKSFDKYRYINLPQEYLLKILGLENNKTYNFYSKFLTLLQRQVKEIKEKTDLQDLMIISPTKEDKKEKIFRFFVNKKSQRTLNNREKIKSVVNNLIKKF